MLETISTQEIAQYLNCSTDHVSWMCRKGKIKAIKPIGRWVIDRKDFEEKYGKIGTQENDSNFDI